jgi:hypothetical protein
MGGNSIMERRIGSCRRELLDRTLVLNQRHLTIVLREYEDFYNAHRPRRALKQAAPPPRGFVPEAEQGRILAGVLAGIELGAWDRQIARWLARLGHQHGADRSIANRPGASRRAGRVRAMTPGACHARRFKPGPPPAHGTLRPEPKGGEQPGTRAASVGRYAASDSR